MVGVSRGCAQAAEAGECAGMRSGAPPPRRTGLTGCRRRCAGSPARALVVADRVRQGSNVPAGANVLSKLAVAAAALVDAPAISAVVCGTPVSWVTGVGKGAQVRHVVADSARWPKGRPGVGQTRARVDWAPHRRDCAENGNNACMHP